MLRVENGFEPDYLNININEVRIEDDLGFVDCEILKSTHNHKKVIKN